VLTELRRFAKQDTMGTTGRVKGILDADPECTAVVDAIGIGAGVVDRLREQKCRTEAFTASRTAGNRRDASREFRYSDMRSFAWWKMREALDPSKSPVICLPDDDQLTGDLCAPKWKVESGARIKVESKDDIRKRIGRSTDDGDAVIQAWVLDGATWLDAYNVVRCDECDRAFMARETACPHCKAPRAA